MRKYFSSLLLGMVIVTMLLNYNVANSATQTLTVTVSKTMKNLNDFSLKTCYTSFWSVSTYCANTSFNLKSDTVQGGFLLHFSAYTFTITIKSTKLPLTCMGLVPYGDCPLNSWTCTKISNTELQITAMSKYNMKPQYIFYDMSISLGREGKQLFYICNKKTS